MNKMPFAENFTKYAGRPLKPVAHTYLYVQ